MDRKQLAILMVTIPIRAEYEYTQDVTLDATAYKFRIKWNYRGQYYTLDVLTKEGATIVSGIKLALFAQCFLRYPGYGLPPGELIVLDTSGNTADIQFEDFDGRISLVYIEEAEVNA